MIGLVVALAGSVGAVTRFVVDGEVRELVARRHPGSRASRWPMGTFVINVSGSLLLGFVTGLTLGWGDAPAWTRAVGSGFCGGYTTFSTASVEALRMMQKRRYRAAAADVLGTLVCTVAAAAIGVWAGLTAS